MRSARLAFHGAAPARMEAYSISRRRLSLRTSWERAAKAAFDDRNRWRKRTLMARGLGLPLVVRSSSLGGEVGYDCFAPKPVASANGTEISTSSASSRWVLAPARTKDHHSPPPLGGPPAVRLALGFGRSEAAAGDAALNMTLREGLGWLS